MSEIRPKRTLAAAHGKSERRCDRGVTSGATLQPRRSNQLVEQRLRFLQIGGVEPLGEPVVDRGDEVASFGGLALGGVRAGKAIAVLRESVRKFDTFGPGSASSENK